MHHTVEVSLPAAATDALLETLTPIDGVLTLTVHRGRAVKPPGDVVVAQVLNRTVDEVLAAADLARAAGPVAVTTSTVASLSVDGAQGMLDADVDESPWEEFRRHLRHHSRLGVNTAALLLLSGAVSLAGLLSPPVPQALALAAAAVFAPAFEPVAQLAVALVRPTVEALRRALVSIVVGYLLIAVAGAVAFLVLRALGLADPGVLARSEGVLTIVDPTAADWLIALCGAVAGTVIVTAFREAALAGALMALALVPATALAGAGLVAGDLPLVLESLQRVVVDVGLVVVAGVVVVALKQRLVHRGRPPLG